MMLLPALVGACASDISGRKPICLAYPHPGEYVIDRLHELAQRDGQVGQWWVAHNRFVERCENIRKGAR